MERREVKMSSITIIKNKLKRGLALTQQESWDLAEYIKALEQQPNRCDSCTHSEEQDGSNCYECVKGISDNFEARPTDADCISREEVMKCFKKWQPYMATRLWDYEQELRELPSVTPSYNSIKTELKPCDDCISREAVMSALFDLWEPTEYNDEDEFLEYLEKSINRLPSVTPTITDVENNFNIGYNCGYADAMSDIAEGSDTE